MATQAAVATGTVNTTVTGTADFTVSGFGTPTAAIVFLSNANTTNNPQGDSGVSVGFWTSSDQRSVGVNADDAVGTVSGYKGYATSCISFPSASAASFLVEISAASITDGLRLTTDTYPDSLARYATVILIKGTTNVKSFNQNGGNTGTTEVTSLGFQPDVVFSTWSTSTADGTPVTTAQLSFGVTHWDSSATRTQSSIGTYHQNAVTTSRTRAVVQNDYALGVAGYSIRGSGTLLSAADADGFTITHPDNYRRYGFLALKLADADDFFTTTFASPTTATTKAVTGAGFTPDALGIVHSFGSTLNTQHNGIALSFGAADSTSEQSVGIQSTNAVSTTDEEAKASTSNIVNVFDDTGDQLVANVDSFDSDGFTLDYTNADATARYGFAFAFGDSTAGGGGVTGDLSAQESGADGASIAGSVGIAGALAATEAASDSAALAGDVAIAGDLAAIESGSDTATILGSAPALISGDLAAIESGSDTATIFGSAPALISGDLAAVESGSDAASVLGGVALAGDLAASEAGSDSAAFYQSQVFTGELVAVESASDSTSLAGLVGEPLSDISQVVIDTCYGLHAKPAIYTLAGRSIICAVIDELAAQLLPDAADIPARGQDEKLRVRVSELAVPARGALITYRGVPLAIDGYARLSRWEWLLYVRH